MAAIEDRDLGIVTQVLMLQKARPDSRVGGSVRRSTTELLAIDHDGLDVDDVDVVIEMIRASADRARDECLRALEADLRRAIRSSARRRLIV